jgi:hypothetical protein
MIDQCHDTIDGSQQSLFATLRSTVVLEHHVSSVEIACSTVFLICWHVDFSSLPRRLGNSPERHTYSQSVPHKRWAAGPQSFQPLQMQIACHSWGRVKSRRMNEFFRRCIHSGSQRGQKCRERQLSAAELAKQVNGGTIGPRARGKSCALPVWSLVASSPGSESLVSRSQAYSSRSDRRPKNPCRCLAQGARSNDAAIRQPRVMGVMLPREREQNLLSALQDMKIFWIGELQLLGRASTSSKNALILSALAVSTIPP